ncbi:hypothetical protein D9M68_838300 [compost metagenome]
MPSIKAPGSTSLPRLPNAHSETVQRTRCSRTTPHGARKRGRRARLSSLPADLLRFPHRAAPTPISVIDGSQTEHASADPARAGLRAAGATLSRCASATGSRSRAALPVCDLADGLLPSLPMPAGDDADWLPGNVHPVAQSSRTVRWTNASAHLPTRWWWHQALPLAPSQERMVFSHAPAGDLHRVDQRVAELF